ncbi:MAG: DUF6152 family protein [Steroidobacteraceae bacterium]
MNHRNVARFGAWIAAFTLAGGMRGAAAHHAGNAFDTSNPQTVSGTVQQFYWTNPHTWIYLLVDSPQGQQEYRFEGMSVSILARAGWTSGSLKPGDKITVTYAPYKDDRKGGEYRTVVTASGETVGAGRASL